MKYLFVFLLVSMSSIVISQNRYHVDKTTFALKDTVVYLKHDMKPINGVLYCDYGDVGIYVKGKKDGLLREWKNGQLWIEGNYKDGKADGLVREWYKDGQLQFEGNYKDGKRDGLIRKWYDDGQLKIETNFKDGKRDGLDRGWHENGQLKFDYNYKDGKLISKKDWDKDGRLGE